MEGTSLLVSLMREPPKKLPTPTPKVVMARPVTFWLARRVTVRKQYSRPISREPSREHSMGIMNGQKAVHFGGGHGLLIEERADDAADAAHIHDAGDTQVQVTGFLRQDLAGAAEQQGDALHDRTGDERYKIKAHLLTPPSLLFLRRTDFVGDEELAADDEEQDDAGQNIGEGVVQARRRWRSRWRRGPWITSSREAEIMMKGLNLDIQETMTAVKPRPSTMVVVRVWSTPAVSMKAHQAAQRAGEHHGADDDAIHLDAGVAGGALALAHNGDLVAVLAVLEIDVHQAGHDGHDQDGAAGSCVAELAAASLRG